MNTPNVKKLLIRLIEINYQPDRYYFLRAIASEVGVDVCKEIMVAEVNRLNTAWDGGRLEAADVPELEVRVVGADVHPFEFNQVGSTHSVIPVRDHYVIRGKYMGSRLDKDRCEEVKP